MGVIDDFSDNFLNNLIGVITGSYASSQFPDIPCNLARFHARSGNPGSIFIATAPNQAFGWELDAGIDRRTRRHSGGLRFSRWRTSDYGWRCCISGDHQAMSVAA